MYGGFIFSPDFVLEIGILRLMAVDVAAANVGMGKIFPKIDLCTWAQVHSSLGIPIKIHKKWVCTSLISGYLRFFRGGHGLGAARGPPARVPTLVVSHDHWLICNIRLKSELDTEIRIFLLTTQTILVC